jgi:hypothetical protein
MTADVPSRIAFATSGASGLRPVDHRLEHLGRRDRGLAAVEGTQDDSLLEERHVGRADLDSEISSCDHDGV